MARVARMARWLAGLADPFTQTAVFNNRALLAQNSNLPRF